MAWWHWTYDRWVMGLTPGGSLLCAYYLDGRLSTDWQSISVYNQHQGQLSLPIHPSNVRKSSNGLLAGVEVGCIHLCQVAGNTVWSHMAGDAL